MRLPHRIMTPPDRGANRLLSLSHGSDIVDGTTGGGLQALGAVVQAYGAERLCGRGNRRACDHALRAAVRQVADEARARDARRAELMLIALKAAWARLPAVQRCEETRIRTALWDRVVLLCCREFYAVDGADARGSVA